MSRSLLALPILVAVTIAGCGGSTTTVVTQASPPSTTTTVTRSVTGSSGTPTPTSAAGSRCDAADLRPRFLGQQGAMGRGLLGIALRNVSGHSCHSFGYPGVLFLAASGAPLPTDARRTTQDFVGSAREAGLDVAPGAAVSFRLSVTHGINSSAGCRTAAGLQVIPPDDTRAVRIAIPGGAYECGVATVTPLQPGSSAFH